MKKNIKVHPEISIIETICSIAPDTEYTREICEKINQYKAEKPKKKRLLSSKIK